MLAEPIIGIPLLNLPLPKIPLCPRGVSIGDLIYSTYTIIFGSLNFKVINLP